MQQWAPVISVLALLFSIATFVWLHLRARDAAVCTLVASECDFAKKNAIFQFAVANLGTRSLMLRGARVSIYYDASGNGVFLDLSKCRNQLPLVLKPGEMTAITVESPWDERFLSEAAAHLEKQGGQGALLNFRAIIVVWGPTGKRLSASETIGSYEKEADPNSQCFSTPEQCTFRLTRSRS